MLRKFISTLFRSEIQAAAAGLTKPFSAAAPTELTITNGVRYGDAYRSRYDWDRTAIFTAAIRAWRLNPLARELTRLYKIFTIDGLKISSSHKPSDKFLQELINHDMNKLMRLWPRYALELFLTGNTFTRFTVQDGGMSLIRGYPADMISEIVTEPNDIEQEIEYKLTPMDQAAIPAFNNNTRQSTFMLHHSINRPLGCLWGEPEIGPDLPWLERYATFLENRLRLNYYRNAFMWDVTAEFTSEKERADREIAINSNPPKPGQVNVHNAKETWQALSPQLHSGDAQTDGISIKKLIAAGVGYPLHYLAEPESSTRTTAEAAGTATFKTFEDAQNEFKVILTDILSTALKVRARSDNKIKPDAEIVIQTADPTERDNASLALAVARVTVAMGEMFDRELISSDEFLRFVYRFGGETLPPGFTAPAGIRKPLDTQPARSSQGSGIEDDQTDPDDDPVKDADNP